MSVVRLDLKKINNKELPNFSSWWNHNKLKYEGLVSMEIAKEIWGESNDLVLIVLEHAIIEAID